MFNIYVLLVEFSASRNCGLVDMKPVVNRSNNNTNGIGTILKLTVVSIIRSAIINNCMRPV